MTAKRKQRQRCTPPTTSRQGQAAQDSRRRARGILIQFQKLFIYARELFIRVGDLFISMREPFIRARDQDVGGCNCLRVRRGIHGRSLSCHPKEAVGPRPGPTNRQTLNAVLTKAWPDDGKYWAQGLRELLRERTNAVATAMEWEITPFVFVRSPRTAPSARRLASHRSPRAQR